MPKITNIYGWPDALVRALSRDDYDKGDAEYSVTGLLRPPRVAALEKKYAEHLEEDVSSRLDRFFGSTAHKLIEHASVKELAEKRLYIDVDGVRVSGRGDLYDPETGLLTDIKITKVNNVLKGYSEAEWSRQGNMYKFMYEQNGYDVNGVQIVALLKDWERWRAEDDARKNPGRTYYPQVPVVVIPLSSWTSERALTAFRTRIRLHKSAEKALPNCTEDERFLNDSRCKNYCLVSKFCTQWAQISGRPVELPLGNAKGTRSNVTHSSRLSASSFGCEPVGARSPVVVERVVPFGKIKRASGPKRLRDVNEL